MNRDGRGHHWYLALACLALCGCRFGRAPTVEDILADPAKYEGKTLALKGTIGSPVQIFGYGTCKLTDETGTITVITAGESRSAGQETTIRGKVKSTVTLGAKTLVVLIEEGAKEPPGTSGAE